MKNPREIFKNKDYLLEEPEVEQLLEYCEKLQDEIIEFKFEKDKNKEIILIDMIKETLKGCNEIQKQQAESIRFGYDPANFEQAITNLKSYIQERCRDERIWL